MKTFFLIIIIFFSLYFLAKLNAQMILTDVFLIKDGDVFKTELYADDNLELTPYIKIYYYDGRKEIKFLDGE